MDFVGSGNFFVSGVYNTFDKVAVREHFQNLCAEVGVDCKEHFARAQTSSRQVATTLEPVFVVRKVLDDKSLHDVGIDVLECRQDFLHRLRL